MTEPTSGRTHSVEPHHVGRLCAGDCTPNNCAHARRQSGRTTSCDHRNCVCPRCPNGYPLPHDHDGDRCVFTGRSLSCANGCDLPDDEPLFDITGEQFHAVMVRAAKGWESYYGPEPAEYEPCGPVTAPARTLSDDVKAGLYDEMDFHL